MLSCLEEPIKQLEEVLEKIKKRDSSIESDYINSQIKDKEEFKSCIDDAIKKITQAYEKHTSKISDSYPSSYKPYKELNWVSKDEFEEKKGKKLEYNNAEFALVVVRYENGEMFYYQDGQKYGLYIN
jgi:hypothetical protein